MPPVAPRWWYNVWRTSVAVAVHEAGLAVVLTEMIDFWFDSPHPRIQMCLCSMDGEFVVIFGGAR